MALTVPVDSNSVTGRSFRSGNWSATSLRTRPALMSTSSACILIRCSSPSLLLAATRIEPGAAALKLVFTGYEVARNHHGRSPAPVLSIAAPPATLGRVQPGVAVGHRVATRSTLDGFR